MTMVEYRRRASVLEKSESLWRASPDRLEQVGPDGAILMTVPYRNVQAVRLTFAPSRFQTTRFLMELSGARSQLIVSNMHFKGFAQFEDRSDTFLPLVRQVVAGVELANPGAVFRAGEKPGVYWSLLALALGTMALLVAVVLLLPLAPGNAPLSAILKAGVILFSLPILLAWAVHSRPRHFQPRTDLEKVLSERSD